MHTLPNKIGIAGLGTVGSGLLSLLKGSVALQGVFGHNTGVMELAGVSARSRGRDRGVSLEGVTWFDDPRDLARSSDIDIFVELIGGEDGVARECVEIALRSGKHVVTANKALLASHGLSLAALAEENNVALRYEAAVAGGVPIISALREGAAAISATKIQGILNGTCNYILTRMETAGLEYHAALKEAQDLGYAEADPTLDVGGYDAAHKLAILSAIAFGEMPDQDEISVTGINHVTGADIAAASNNGFKIRLIATGERDGPARSLKVAPVLVSFADIFSAIQGPENHIRIEGPPIGVLNLSGPGAGAGPTAAAVAGDILAILHGARGPVFGVCADNIASGRYSGAIGGESRFYVRVEGDDDFDKINAIMKFMEDEGIIIQTLSGARRQDYPEPLILLTSPLDVAAETKMRDHLLTIQKKPRIE